MDDGHVGSGGDFVGNHPSMVAGEVAVDGWAGSYPVVPRTGCTALVAIVPEYSRDERDAVYAGLERAAAAVLSREETSV